MKEDNIFEMKIVHRIYGPICVGGQWRESYNREMKELYNEPNIANVIKSSRLKWAGRIVRMDENELPKRVFKWTITVVLNTITNDR